MACLRKRRGRWVIGFYDQFGKRRWKTLKEGTTKGTPIDHHNLVRRYFEPSLTKAQLPRIRFHDLRHTYASLLIEQGENLKYIQSQLGHSNPTITMNVYAHLMKPTNQEAACRLENAIFGGSGSKMVAKLKKGQRTKSVTP